MTSLLVMSPVRSGIVFVFFSGRILARELPRPLPLDCGGNGCKDGKDVVVASKSFWLVLSWVVVKAWISDATSSYLSPQELDMFRWITQVIRGNSRPCVRLMYSPSQLGRVSARLVRMSGLSKIFVPAGISLYMMKLALSFILLFVMVIAFFTSAESRAGMIGSS